MSIGIKGRWSAEPPLLGVSEKFRNLKSQLDLECRTSHNLFITGETGTEIFSCINYLLQDIDDSKISYYSATSTLPVDSPRVTILDSFEWIKNQENFIQTLQSTRVIALSHLPLSTLNNDFGVDFSQRFNFVEITIPPLRERREDIIFFIDYFVQTLCKQKNIDIPNISFDAIIQMVKYDWPGNLTELENVMLRTLIESPATIHKIHELPHVISEPLLHLQPLSDAVKWVEKQLVTLALNRYDGNRHKAAQALGISEPNLRYKMKKLQIRKKFVAG